KASFSSHTSMSSILRPWRSRSLGTAYTGPMPISSGSQPATAKPRNTSLGRIPRAFARSIDITRVELAPSESCDELPAGAWAVAGVLVEVRRQLQEAFEGRVRAIALVLLDVVRLLTGDLALLVEDAARHVHRRQLFLEEAFLLSPRGALLAQERVAVLRLTAD